MSLGAVKCAAFNLNKGSNPESERAVIEREAEEPRRRALREVERHAEAHVAHADEAEAAARGGGHRALLSLSQLSAAKTSGFKHLFFEALCD